MCSPGWGNLVAIEWNDLPVGREFEGKFLKNVKSPPHALPPSLPCRLNIDRCINLSISLVSAVAEQQILKTPFNMTSSCILDFQATRPATFYSSSVYCTLANRKVFLRQITADFKHNSAQLDKWLEILAVEGLTPKER